MLVRNFLESEIKMNNDVWNSSCDTKNMLIYWEMTHWCTYGCSYCLQVHDKTNHAFNHHSVDEWLDKFSNLENPKLAFCITGGEPFLDKVSFHKLLFGLTNMKKVDNIRIDTNAFWNPEDYKDLDLKKIYLMVSFHPEKVTADDFITKIKSMINYGFQIPMVTIVLLPEFVDLYTNIRNDLAEFGIKVNANIPVQASASDKQRLYEIIKPHVNPLDFGYRCCKFSPKGELCHFPQLSVMLNWEGKISDCTYKQIGNLFEGDMPKLPQNPLVCNQQCCNCVGLYSMLDGFDRWNKSMNMLKEYAESGLK